MIYTKVLENTVIDLPRLMKLQNLLKSTDLLLGNVCEVGVARGGSALWLCQNTNSIVYLIDTFTGMPEVSEHDNTHKKGDFKGTSVMHVLQLLHEYNFALLPGEFNEKKYDLPTPFRFVHLDVDIYQSYIDCLEYFKSRMVKGGIIVLDDYGFASCKGAKLACDEMALKCNWEILPGASGQAYIQF